MNLGDIVGKEYLVGELLLTEGRQSRSHIPGSPTALKLVPVFRRTWAQSVLVLDIRHDVRFPLSTLWKSLKQQPGRSLKGRKSVELEPTCRESFDAIIHRWLWLYLQSGRYLHTK